MDFVVAGLGFGALVVVVGFVIRDIGPLLWKRLGHGAFSKDDEEQYRWRALCHRLAAVLTLAGCLVLAATIAAILAGVSDADGEKIALAASVVAVLGAIVGVVLTIRAYGQATPVSIQPLTGVSRQSAITTSAIEREPASERGRGRDRKRAKDEPVAPPLPVDEIPPPDSDLWDPTRLLPSEFDHHDEEAPGEAPLAVEPVVATVVEPSPEPVEETEETEEIVESPSEMPVAEAGRFKSSLLADIESSVDAPASNGTFSSGLLADVSPHEAPDEPTYQSPIFANLTSDEAKAAGEEETTETAEAQGEEQPAPR